ncbi:MAG: PEGA domain-containing protein, partial [Clostridia bacterium]|nr:PEGA domain-containing protein [Deltaproteobacteria bacterium]
YASPEQATGRSVGSRSDIYGVGALFFELLTRTPLFDGASDAIVLEKVKQGEIYPPRFITPSIPADIEAIVLKALATNPDDRYQSAESMHGDVVAALIRNHGHQQPRDLASFVCRLFEDEHKSETARIEHAMRITAMPDRVPGYQASGIERTAMVDLAASRSREDEPNRVEPTRISSVFDNDVAAKSTRKPIDYTFGADADDQPDDGATAIVRQSDLKRIYPLDGETAIVRPSQKYDHGYDDDHDDKTAIVRDRRPTIERSRGATPDAWLAKTDERNEATDPNQRSPVTEQTDRARIRRGADIESDENTDRVTHKPARPRTARSGPQDNALGELYEIRARQNRRLIWIAVALGLLVIGLGVALVASLRRPQPVGTIGSLVIVSQPLGAEVVLDGSVIGTTPYSSSRILVGRHDVIVRDFLGHSKHRVVTIESVGVTSLDVALLEK